MVFKKPLRTVKQELMHWKPKRLTMIYNPAIYAWLWWNFSLIKVGGDPITEYIIYFTSFRHMLQCHWYAFERKKGLEYAPNFGEPKRVRYMLYAGSVAIGFRTVRETP